MTDQTPRTEAGRRLVYQLYDGDPYFVAQVLAIEAEAAAQARTECEERNERLQQTLALHTRTDSVTMTTEHYEELAQARTEALDVEVLAEALPDYLLDTENGMLHREPVAQQIAAAYRAILAGETDRV